MNVLAQPVPCKWWLQERGPYGASPTIHRCGQMEGPDLYKVMQRSWCLNKNHKWDYEPQPSSRDDEYLAMHRFASFEEALEAARLAEEV